MFGTHSGTTEGKICSVSASSDIIVMQPVFRVWSVKSVQSVRSVNRGRVADNYLLLITRFLGLRYSSGETP